MSLKVRKIAYVVIGSGALYSFALALLWFVKMASSPSSGNPLVLFLVSTLPLGGVVGVSSGLLTILLLPDVKRLTRIVLSAGIVYGILVALFILYAALSASSVGWPFATWVYIAFLPLLVGVCLLLELWHFSAQPPHAADAAAPRT